MEARLEAAPTFRGGTKLIVGLFFTAVGILLTADNFDLIDADDYLRFWPVVLVAAGLVKLAEPRGPRIVGGLLTLVGAGLLADTLGWVEFSTFDLWPLVLIAIGGLLIARALGFSPEASAPNLAIFSNRRNVETSRNYRGGRYAAMLGGYELDLTGADITDGPAIIDTFAFWGAVEITVPEGWEVIGEVMPVMAGFDVKTSPPATPAKKLIIRGWALQAGIEVKSASRRTS